MDCPVISIGYGVEIMDCMDGTYIDITNEVRIFQSISPCRHAFLKRMFYEKIEKPKQKIQLHNIMSGQSERPKFISMNQSEEK